MPNESFANYKPQGVLVRLQVKYFPEYISFGEYKEGFGEKRAESRRELITNAAHIQVSMGKESICFYQPECTSTQTKLLESQLDQVRTAMQNHERERLGFGDTVDCLEGILKDWNRK